LKGLPAGEAGLQGGLLRIDFIQLLQLSVLNITIHPHGVKGTSGAAMRLPTMHPDGVGR